MTITGRVVNYYNKILTVELDKEYEFKPDQPTEVKFKSRDIHEALRGLLWVFIDYLAKVQGYSRPEMYLILKDELGYYDEVQKPNGKFLRVYKSTANGEIDNQNLSQFLTDAEQWAIGNGIDIDPYIVRHNFIRAQREK